MKANRQLVYVGPLDSLFMIMKLRLERCGFSVKHHTEVEYESPADGVLDQIQTLHINTEPCRGYSESQGPPQKRSWRHRSSKRRARKYRDRRFARNRRSEHNH